MKIFVYPYNMRSNSAREIAKGLGCKIIKTQDSSFVPSKDKLVINWGSSTQQVKEIKNGGVGRMLNWPTAIDRCSNKISFFNTVKDHCRIPEYTENVQEAIQWDEEGRVVIGRVNTRTTGGKGMYFSDEEDEEENSRHWLNRCIMWSVYVPKAREFRVHIVNGEVIDVTEKKLRTNDENGVPVDKAEVNWRVRSHYNGFIFARENVQVPEDVNRQAILAFNAIPNLHFGAMDVIYNNKREEAYVLECNTAPGLEGTTLTKYIEAFQRIIA